MNRIEACPRCEYPLLPVFEPGSSRRRVIALTCPEPYCDHMRMVTRKESREIAKRVPRSRAAR